MSEKKCEKCKWQEDESLGGTGCCDNPNEVFWICSKERRIGVACGPEGKLFEPREAGEGE